MQCGGISRQMALLGVVLVSLVMVFLGEVGLFQRPIDQINRAEGGKPWGPSSHDPRSGDGGGE